MASCKHNTLKILQDFAWSPIIQGFFFFFLNHVLENVKFVHNFAVGKY